MALDAAAFADLLAGYCSGRAGAEILVRSTTLAQPLLLECQAPSSPRRLAAARSELPGATAAFHRQARDRHLDTFPEVAWAEAKKAHAQPASRPENTRA